MKVIGGALVYWWAWFFYAPVHRKKIVHQKGRRVLRRTYVLERLHMNGGELIIKKPLRVGVLEARGGTLTLCNRVDCSGGLTMWANTAVSAESWYQH